jgi:hypothetical protein
VSTLDDRINMSGAIQVGSVGAKVHALQSLDIHRCVGGEITITVFSVAKAMPQKRVRLWLSREQVAYLAASIAGPSDSAALLATKSVYVVQDHATHEYVDGSSERTLLKSAALTFDTPDEAQAACVRVHDRPVRVDLPGG